MGAWGTSIFSDDLALDIRREYNVLLSIGKDNATSEEMLINYYADILSCNNPDADVFWFALALCEWKKGRLSSLVKEKALNALKSGNDLARWNTVGNEKNYTKRKKVLSDFQNLILSPMPSCKKVKKPTIHHCPWKVGSLLSYRISSNEKFLNNHPCFLQYVLLRIVRIAKHPISKLFDTGYYNESMLVGLYNWIGREMPNPQIVHSLEYSPIQEFALLANTDSTYSISCTSLPNESREKVQRILDSCYKKRVEKCVWLDWRSAKGKSNVITYLDCDENFCNNIPEFFKPTLSSSSYTSPLSFDITLSQRFSDAFTEGQGDGLKPLKK